jgi:hypothetical protein
MEFKSNYTGSEKTYELVKNEIEKRWGKDESGNYDPFINCFTFKQWSDNGYRVKKGETGIRSFVVLEKKDKKTGEVLSKRLKTIYLFYKNQVEPVSS